MIAVFTAQLPQPVLDAALVLTAMGIDHEIEQSPAGWSLLVEEADQPLAHRQLSLYWAENQPSAVTPVTVELVDSGWPGVLGYLAVIWMVPSVQTMTGADLTVLGRMQADLVTQGEWWRVVTALTLHADIAHIAANSVFGVVFGLFVGRHLGSGFGWLLVLLCGAAGNLLNALVQPSGFRAIGASTATFAAMGIVPAFGWRRGFFRGRGFKRGFAPIFGAIALLAFTGFGSPNVDALGHVFGFAAGIAAGLGVARVNLTGMSTADQQRAGVFALLLIGTAWLFAV